MVTDDALPGSGPGRAVELAADWALWGKRGTDRTYRIVACSAGDLTAADFEAAVRRYAPGLPETLPQYLVFWVPGLDGGQEYVGIAVYENAAWSHRDPRDRYDARGRPIVYTRLFCVRYADLAEHGVNLGELVEAARRQPLPPDDQIGPVALRVSPPGPEPAEQSPPAARELAETVAALLLTCDPVCVLGAGNDVTADERLAFIDQVLSLLPYGLRATLSASTWASPTAQDLKFRLYFAGARPGGPARTHHVRWGDGGAGAMPAPASRAARRYLEWLRRTGSRARFLLVGETTPLRFVPVDIETMVAARPDDLQATDTVQDLAASLRDGDARAATDELIRLERHARGPVSPADRDRFRAQVTRHGLLGSHPELKTDANKRLYRTVIPLAFEVPITYAGYCEIEDAAGGPPRGTLRSVLTELPFAGYIPRLLVLRAEPSFSDGELMETLAREGQPPTGPLDECGRSLPGLRPAHRAAVLDFAVQHLCARAADARTYLARRGYLAGMLEDAFPDDVDAQRVRLEDTLLFVFGPRLSRGQIRDLFSQPNVRLTPALERAVTRLASASRADRFVAEQAADARTRQAAEADRDSTRDEESGQGRRGAWRRALRRRPQGHHEQEFPDGQQSQVPGR